LNFLNRTTQNDAPPSFLSGLSARLQGFSPLNEQEEESILGLTAWQRMIGFGICLAMAAIFFLVCFILLPVVVWKPRKFATCFTLGSIFCMMAFSILRGPQAHLLHMLSKERWLFTTAYVGSMVGTLYFSMLHPDSLLTLLFCVIQIVALAWYLVSYLPGGTSTLSYGSRYAAQNIASLVV